MECYTAFELISETFGEFIEPPRDYFYAAKSNEYSALHAVLAGPGGKKLQFLICTEDLEKVAEFGIVASKQFRLKTKNIELWFKNTLENISDTEDVEESIEILKMDLFGDEITTYTPKGKIIRLPKNSSCIDFAFAVHTQLGYRSCGATVNNERVPITTTLKPDAVVQILTSEDAHPQKDWEEKVKTSKAKNAIRNWFQYH